VAEPDQSRAERSDLSPPGGTMPPILYGTAWKEARTAALVTDAIAAGFRGFDTACQPKHYHEPGVGAGIAASRVARAALYVQTKFTPLAGHDPHRVPYDAQAPLAEQVRQSAAVSLANLGTTWLDALLLHSPLARAADQRAVWQAMEGLVDEGRVRMLGISNCYELARLDELVRAARIPPAVLQNRFHAATGYDRALRAWCRARDIVYQSFWTLTANGALLADPRMRAIARRHGVTPAQILFRYLTQAGVVPLTGTSSRAHMRDDLAIFEFTLSDADCDAIDGLLDAQPAR
jgi:diketogulonate reductase-like aldo/keto reductase